MEFSIKHGDADKQHADCLVVGVFEEGKLSQAAEQIDRVTHHLLSELIKQGDISGKANSSLLIPKINHLEAKRVLVIGLGKAEEFAAKQYQDAIRTACAALHKTNSQSACLSLVDLEVKNRNLDWQIKQLVLIAEDSVYRCDSQKSKPADAATLSHITLHTVHSLDESAHTTLIQAVATAHGAALCKNLGNLPGNICTPSYLADQAKQLAKQHKLKATVLEEKDMEKLGMFSLLSVAAGSSQPAKLITLEYRGADKKQKPVVLVGKGVTFDSGGISLKPGAEMDEMKYDMCGAASVLGTMLAIAEMALKLNVVAVLPCTENLPSGKATKPGDIVTSLSGQTIEILNTDAEGRLILCDALTYAARFEPDTVIDIATLTGACVIALGSVATGLFSNHDELAQALLKAGEESHDRAWQMPLWDDYQGQLDSNFADMQNIGGRAAGSVTAACFLSRFTKDYRWAHLDIAGTAWRSGKDKGATGRPVPLLTQYLIQRAQAA